MAASAMGLSGRTVTKDAGKPKAANETATFASPPPKVATNTGAVASGLMIGSKVTGTKISAFRNRITKDTKSPQPRRNPSAGG